MAPPPPRLLLPVVTGGRQEAGVCGVLLYREGGGQGVRAQATLGQDGGQAAGKLTHATQQGRQADSRTSSSSSREEESANHHGLCVPRPDSFVCFCFDVRPPATAGMPCCSSS